MGKNKGGGGGGAHSDLVQSKAAAKPAGLSMAPVWSTQEDSKDTGGFTVVGKKKNQGGQQGGYSSTVGAAVAAPKPKQPVVKPGPKPQPQLPKGPIVGGDAVAPTKNKNPWGNAPKPQAKQQKQKQQQQKPQEEEDPDAGWSTVMKVPAVAKAPQVQKSDKQLANEARREKAQAIAQANMGVIGAVPAELTKEEKKKQEKEAKKRAKEMEKQRLEKQAREAAKAEENDGFEKVSKGPQAKKVKASIESFGEATAWSTLQKKGPQHKKLPKAQQAREVGEVSEEARQAMIRKQFEALTKKPPATSVEFRVLVQDSWYPIRQLLATNDFAHAPKMVQAQAQREKALGGFFIFRGEKYWSNNNTVDDMWMAMSYLTGLTKLFKNIDSKDSITVTPYWAGKGGDASCSITVNKPTLQEQCHPAMTLKHEQKHPVQLQEVTVSIYDFVNDLLAECEVLGTFLDKMEQAMDEVAETKKFKSGANADKLKKIRGTLPQKFDGVVQELKWAFDEFAEKHPLPTNKA